MNNTELLDETMKMKFEEMFGLLFSDLKLIQKFRICARNPGGFKVDKYEHLPTKQFYYWHPGTNKWTP